MSENNIDLSIITDDDSIYYFTGYHDFLHMDFNRPTLLIVSNDHKTYLITPLLDVLLVPDDCPVDTVETWNDGIGNEWRELLPQIINQHKNIFIEKMTTVSDTDLQVFANLANPSKANVSNINDDEVDMRSGVSEKSHVVSDDDERAISDDDNRSEKSEVSQHSSKSSKSKSSIQSKGSKASNTSKMSQTSQASSLSESESDSFMEVFTGRRVVELGAVGGGRLGMPGCNDCVLFLNIVFCIFCLK